MNKTLKTILTAAVAAIVVVVGFRLLVGNQSADLGASTGITRYPNGGLAAHYLKLSTNPSAATAGTDGTLTVGSGGSALTNFIKGTATYNPPSLADGVVATTTVTVTGAATGDTCTAGFDAYGAVIGGINVTCQISATNTAFVTMDNESTVTQDNATGTLTVWSMH